MPLVERRPKPDHARVRISTSRLLLVWGIAFAVAATFLLVKSSDRDARRDAAMQQAQALSSSTGGLVEAEVRASFDRLQSTANALLRGEVDRATLDAASPVTGLPLLTVLDSQTVEILAINLDVPVDGPQIIAWMPSIARAFTGERSVGQLAGITDTPIVAFALPYTAHDGSERVLAVGSPLAQSRFAEVMAATPSDVHVAIHASDDTTLLDNGVPDTDGIRAISSRIPGTDWNVHVAGSEAAFDPDLAAPLQDPRILGALALLVVSLLAAWVTRALSDAATIEAAYGRLAWGARQQREFSALMSHELRTPATSASGLAAFLAERWDHIDPERRRELAERVARSTSHLAELVQNLDLSSRLAEGILPLRPTQQQVVTLVNGALEHAGTDREHVMIRGDLDAVVAVDGRYAVRALAGLITNARVHGGAPIEISVAVERQDVAIVVRDHGPGVPRDFRDHLFEPFTQAQSHLRRTHGGTGLGLHLVAAIIEQLGGRISHHDARPGAAFVVHLPVRDHRRSTKTEPVSAIRAAT